MQTSSQNPDRPDPKAPETNIHLGALPERMFVNFRSLVMAIDTLRPFLELSRSPTESVDLPESVKKEAAETFGILCARMNVLTVDDRNWDVTAFDQKFLKSTDEMNALNEQTARARMEVMRHQSRPSVLLGATFIRRGDQIVAYLGGDSPENAPVVVSAPSVIEALDALDKKLLGSSKS